MKKTTIGDVMTLLPECIEVSETIEKAEDVMKKHDVRHLPVIREGKVVGIVSDRDLALAIVRYGTTSNVCKAPVGHICTKDVVMFDPDTPLARALREMADRRIGSVIVTSDTGPTGILTATDACRVFSDWLDNENNQ